MLDNRLSHKFYIKNMSKIIWNWYSICNILLWPSDNDAAEGINNV